MKYIIIFIFILGCKPNDKNLSSLPINEPKYKQRIRIYGNNNDTVSSISLRNWQGILPDSVYLKPVFSISISDSSNIIIKDDFLKQMKHVGIEESKLNNDTLFINKVCENLDYLYLNNLNCVITNDDSISIKRLHYGFDKKGKNCFALEVNKITDLDSLYIYAPYENIVIPTNKKYKHITICSLNKQDTLRKYYEYVNILSYCK